MFLLIWLYTVQVVSHHVTSKYTVQACTLYRLVYTYVCVLLHDITVYYRIYVTVYYCTSHYSLQSGIVHIKYPHADMLRIFLKHNLDLHGYIGAPFFVTILHFLTSTGSTFGFVLRFCYGLSDILHWLVITCPHPIMYILILVSLWPTRTLVWHCILDRAVIGVIDRRRLFTSVILYSSLLFLSSLHRLLYIGPPSS